MTPRLAEGALRLLDWLKAAALPIWWEVGADRVNGGFFEQIAQAGQPVPLDRRARVQARQIYSYATAGRLGWEGPWREAVDHGLKFFLGAYLREDGLFRTLVHPDGGPADDAAWLYDQAFGLLALAEAARSFPARSSELHGIATRLVGALEDRRLTGGGFRESSQEHAFQSNPHMHLLEAALAWRELDRDPAWDAIADEIVGLSLERYIDANGAVHEFFAADWSLEPGIAGRIVEPGHQFEWSWLLQRWAAFRGRADAEAAALRLFEIGAGKGVDRARGVAFDQLLDDFSVHSATARLWPQTERIKAAFALALRRGGAPQNSFASEAEDGLAGLEMFLKTKVPGLWRDKMKPDGGFVDEPAPASSFYHIVCAAAVLADGLGLRL